MDREVRQVLDNYPRIYFACHARHRRDPSDGTAISEHRASVLDHLDTVEPTALKDLAAQMGVTPSTMSLTVTRLVRDGYVSRGEDPDDRRRLVLRLTDAGERMKRAAQVLEPLRVRRMLSLLPPRDRRRALDGLRLLAGAASRSMEAYAASAGRGPAGRGAGGGGRRA